MDKALARRLVEELVNCQRILDGAEVVARGIEDQGEQQRIRKAIMTASGMLYTEIMLGIASEHPDLDRTRKGGT